MARTRTCGSETQAASCDSALCRELVLNWRVACCGRSRAARLIRLATTEPM